MDDYESDGIHCRQQRQSILHAECNKWQRYDRSSASLASYDATNHIVMTMLRVMMINTALMLAMMPTMTMVVTWVIMAMLMALMLMTLISTAMVRKKKKKMSTKKTMDTIEPMMVMIMMLTYVDL